ncbi:MAG: Do family serine endopeptidase [Bacteroidales bacterium]|nr:Do family serine endopeptidase [Bacteroidales bacterium]MCF8326839.1 Do family serine endopeptidase [Bacteroidales bacterium]
MKKYLSTILAAFAGAILALGLYHLLLSPQEQSSQAEYTSASQEAVTAYQTGNTSTSYNASKTIVGPDFGAAADKTVHAVVHIKTKAKRRTTIYEQFFGLEPRNGDVPMRASGSGVIISSDGYILTNNHVVESAEEIKVTLNDKRTYDAKIEGLDPSTDLALIKIDEKNLPYLEMGDSDKLSIGEWVLAVGNPFNLTSTVTAGIVSAKARNINILGKRSAIESFIQTDAAVNRGNSGGALVNTEGELVGINAAIASNTGSYTGYSFAIPVNIAEKVANDLKKYGMVQRAFIGVTIRDINSKLAEKEDIDKLQGVYIDGVEDDGAADKGGLKEGDIIVSIDGNQVNSSGRLLELIAQYHPGDKVDINYIRNNKKKSVTLVLQGRTGKTKLLDPDELSISSVLGATLENAEGDQLQRLGIEQGVQVTELRSGKLKSAGIREGFIITHVDKKKVDSAEELKDILSEKEGGVLIKGVYPNGMQAYYGFGL